MVRVFLFLILMVHAVVYGQVNAPETLKVMSFNIRMNTASDGINQWSNRKDWVAQLVQFNQIDVVGMQEVLHDQLVDLQQRLPAYQHVGQGREGADKGEYSPIFFLRNKYELLKSGTFWLSLEPNKVGEKSWDAALPRIATWAELKDKDNGRSFIFINTHFDHKGQNARIQSIKVIEQQLEKIADKGQSIVFTGDFNVAPDNQVYRDILKAGFEDTRTQAHHKFELGFTFNAWDIEAPVRDRIDYIFTQGHDLAVWKYQELDIQRGARFASDHYPVVATLRWVDQLDLLAKAEHDIRVLNYNIHHGVSPFDPSGFMDVNSLAHLIEKNQVDVVALQEVDRHTLRTGKEMDQLQVLAKKVGMEAEFAKTIDFEQGDYGIAILSKFAILKTKVVRLPIEDQKQESRVLLVCTLELPNGKTLEVATTHLTHDSVNSRSLQAKHIADLTKKHPIDILCGDFNDLETSESLSALEQVFEFDPRFSRQYSIGVDNPTKKIDFVIKAKKSPYSISQHKTFGVSGLSDHALIISDLTQ